MDQNYMTVIRKCEFIYYFFRVNIFLSRTDLNLKIFSHYENDITWKSLAEKGQERYKIS